MLRYLFIVVTVSISALTAVSFLHENPQVVETAVTAYKDRTGEQTARATGAQSPQSGAFSGTVRLRADPAGHFVTRLQLNGRSVTGVVDTGASLIAMNRSEARRIGVNVSPADFIYTVNTANGAAKAARTTLREVRVGTIRVRDIEAVILEDDALNIVLVGMSFLKRLRNFEISGDTLVLTL